MKALIAFILPPAVALVGDRLNRIVLGKAFETRFGIGVRFALGLALGMLVFSQVLLLAALAGGNAAGGLAITALIWGLVELVLWLVPTVKARPRLKLQRGHLWLLGLLPLLYAGWVFGQLSTLEGTLEYDANAFWVFKSKVLYLTQGKSLLAWMHNPSLAYAHWDYPMLVSCLYTLGYGAAGEVDEFLNKVWPFWMVVALCWAVLSLAKIWRYPHPLPIATVTVLCFLPASQLYLRAEGGTIPMVFYTGLASLLMVSALSKPDSHTLGAALLVLAGCAATKFEGVLYAAAWCGVLFPVAWQRGWLKDVTMRKAAFVGIICLLPYVGFRLAGPAADPNLGWWRSGIASPETAWHHFPRVWFLNFASRFFSHDFFNWMADNGGHLKWAGQWVGWRSLVNSELAILPWLMGPLLGLSCWKTGRRLAMASLTAVTLGVLTMLAIVIACLPPLQADPSMMIDFCINTVGRYYFPFFTAWFLGILLTLFPAPGADLVST